MRPANPEANKVVAVLISDPHFSDRPPRARGETKQQWYDAMLRYIAYIKKVSDHHRCPVVCAGDLFNSYDEGPELTNFLIDVMPHVYAVAGNHDLPNHSLDQIDRSSFMTLVKAGTVTFVKPERWVTLRHGWIVRGFSFGQEIRPVADPSSNCNRLAVVHRYIWTTGDCIPGMQDYHVSKYESRLKGYDFALFGDNHTTHSGYCGKCFVYNPGAMIRRTAPEKGQPAMFAVLHEDGTHSPGCLDLRFDLWNEAPERAEAAGLDGKEFVEELMRLADAPLNFANAVDRYLRENPTDEETRETIFKIMEEARANQ